jgi:hypothetical protein
MKLIKLVPIIVLLGPLLLPHSCWSQDASTPRVLGLVREKHVWSRKMKIIPWRSTIFVYKLSNNTEHSYTARLKCPDLREYSEAHPMRHWLQETCHRWQPVTSTAAAVAIPAIQAAQRGFLK